MTTIKLFRFLKTVIFLPIRTNKKTTFKKNTDLEVILWVATEVVDFEVGFLATLSFALTFSDWLVVERVKLVLLF